MYTFNAKPLPHHILEEPEYISQKKVHPGIAQKIQEANDEYFVLNMAQGLMASYMWPAIGGVLIVITFLLLFFIDKEESFNSITFFLLLFSPFVLLGLYYLALYYYNPQKEMVLDRLNGTISYPRLFFSRKKVTISFKLITVFRDVNDRIGQDLILVDRKDKFNWNLAENDCDAYWSFMVWYMDKNRPLPYGSAFFKYRNADFERRKAEGFPKPLYASYIETPEYTPEQQAERERIGGW